MGARYRTIVSAELLTALQPGVPLAEGFRMVRDLGPVPGRHGEAPSYRSHFVEFDDDGAPPEMEGALVIPTLTLRRQDGVELVTITDRSVEREPVA